MFNQRWNFAALPANFTTSRHCLFVYKRQLQVFFTFWSVSSAMWTMAYQDFPRPGTKSAWAPPPQPVRGSIDVKNELVVKGRRKLTRAPRRLDWFQDPCENFMWLWRHRIDVRTVKHILKNIEPAGFWQCSCTA